MMTKAKLGLLHLAMKRLALPEEDYRSILENFGGVRSARDLDPAGFDAVMARFQALGFTSSSRARTYGDRIGMASPAQVATIRSLWQGYASQPTETALNTFLERTAKVSALRFLDAAKAGTVITALKAMTARKANAGAA